MSTSNLPEYPRLKDKCRLEWDDNRDQPVILYPEGLVKLNATGYRILQLTDGTRGLEEVISILEKEYDEDDLEDEAKAFLQGIFEQGLLTDDDG